MDYEAIELPPGYSWDFTTSPVSIVGPHDYRKYTGGGPRQAARITWARHQELENSNKDKS